jgi:MFS family permease
MSSAHPTPLWRNRDFTLYQGGQLLSQFGSNMSRIAYPLLALAVTHSAAKAGYVGAVELVPWLLLALAAGVAADRFERKRLMIAADVAGAAAVGTLGVLVLLHHASLWLILVAAFVDTTASVFFAAAAAGAFRAVVPVPQLATAASASQARAATVRLAAPPVGGALFGVARSLPFLADAVSYAFSSLALLLMRTRFQEERDPAERPRVRDGLTYFWRMPFLRTTVALISVSNFAGSGIQLAVIVLARQHGISGAGVGAFVALTGATTLLGATLSPVLRRLLPMRAILLSEFWAALVYAAFVAVPSVYVLAVAFAVHAFWFPNTDSAVAAYSYALIPDRLLGRTMAASQMLRVAAAPLGPLAAGLLLSSVSPRVAVAALAAPVVAAAALGTAGRSVRELPTLSASPAEAG